MISLNITGDNAEDFQAQVRGFVSLLNGTAPVALVADGGTAQANDKPATRSRKPSPDKPVEQQPEAAAEERPSAPAEQTATTTDAVQSDASAEVTTNSVADEDATDFTKVKARAVPYAQTAGAPALREMLVQAGSENGAFSGIQNDPAAIRKVSDALAAAGF